MLKYGVFYKSGKSESKLVDSFTKKDVAKLRAKGGNASLSPNEKKYLGMGYVVRMVRV